MYYIQRGNVTILMLGGGTKSSQQTDIDKAIALAKKIEDWTMVKVSELPSFDMAEQLRNEEDIQIYLNLVLEENDPALLAAALGDIAKARGMTQIAKDAGIGRESLYKALRADASPRYETIAKVIAALGLKLTVTQV